MSGVNVHDPKYREAKPPQGGPSVPLTDLFRLDGRTVVSMLIQVALLLLTYKRLSETDVCIIMQSPEQVAS